MEDTHMRQKSPLPLPLPSVHWCVFGQGEGWDRPQLRAMKLHPELQQFAKRKEGRSQDVFSIARFVCV